MKFQDVLNIKDSKLLAAKLEELTSFKSSEVDQYIKQYSGKHKILNKANKQIKNDTNRPEENFSNIPGETSILSGENVRAESKIVLTAKNVFNIQKVITEYGMMFLFGSPVRIMKTDGEDSTQEAFKAFKKLWKKTKCDSLNMKITREMKIKTNAIEQWFYDAEKKKLRVGMFSYPNSEITPIFDNYGDLISIIRKYSLPGEVGKSLTAFEVLTETEYIYVIQTREGFTVEKTKHGLGKIPSVYWCQPEPDWKDVQGLIDRLEDSSSGHSDTNDYNVDPVLGLDDSVLNMPDKGQSGKVLTFNQDNNESKRKISDMAAFIQWDQSIDSMKYEHELLQDFINKITFTPDVTPDKLKSLSNVSAVGIEMLFFNALLKAKRSWEEQINEYMDRRASILKEFMKIMPEYKKLGADVIDRLEIDFEMTSVLPKNITEIINNVASLRPGKLLASTETAVGLLPYETDTEAETEKIKEEESSTPAESYNL